MRNELLLFLAAGDFNASLFAFIEIFSPISIPIPIPFHRIKRTQNFTSKFYAKNLLFWI